MDDSSRGHNKQRHPERTEPPPPPRRSQSDNNSPSEASQIQATGGSTSNSNGSRSRGAEQPWGAPPAETTRTPPTKPSKTRASVGVGAFGPVVGLSVVVAVSMAGLLGGRLWAVACVCAWLAALSRLRLREATAAAAGEVVAVDVDSTDHKEPVVLRGLLERDRRKAEAAA